VPATPRPSSLTLRAAAPQRARAFGRVLIVDDNTELVATLHAVLVGPTSGDGQGARFEVVTASRGEEALAIAQTHGFDVAIVDVKLPDASGVDLIRPLRAASPLSEVVLITGFASVDARVVLMNRKASAFAGVTSDDALGRSFTESWIPPEDRSKVRDAIAQTQHADRAREVETGFLDSSGATKRRVRWHLSRAREDGGTARASQAAASASDVVYAIGIDVTERRALEKRAADGEAMSAMGALALNLAHEIRNPLNAAVLQLHLLGRNIDKLEADEATRSSLHKRAQIVGDEIGRLNRLLTEFLELARPRGIAREAVHVAQLVDDVLDLERESAAARRIKIERVIPADGCVAIGDREKLKQVIINLVVNSIEAMKEGGVLTARVELAGEQVTIAIEDTGVGIPADAMASVFDPFFTTKEAGTGLGLSIVRKIVDAHGGEVHIDSARGVGTRVTVSIPTGR